MITEPDKVIIAQYVVIIMERNKPLKIEKLKEPLKTEMIRIRKEYTPQEIATEVTNNILGLYG